MVQRASGSNPGTASRRLENSPFQSSGKWVAFSDRGRIMQRKRTMGSAFHMLSLRISEHIPPGIRERRRGRVVRAARLWCRKSP